MLEVRFKFRVMGFYLRIYHNHLADWITRATQEAVSSKMQPE